MPDEFGRHSRDEILARLRELDEMGDGARIIELERRVLVLTTALTECAEKLESLAGIDIGGQLVAHHARAVLTATPTESEAP